MLKDHPSHHSSNKFVRPKEITTRKIITYNKQPNTFQEDQNQLTHQYHRKAKRKIEGKSSKVEMETMFSKIK